MRAGVAVALFCISLVAGCGSNSGTWSCNSASIMVCEDYTALMTQSKISNLQSQCMGITMGTWQHQACDHAKSLGGCSGRLDANDPESQTVTWYYDGADGLHSAAEVQTFCEGQNKMFLPPSIQ